ncbi:biotin transporter BioY [Hoyosella altamirensis]|uniref:Biotin transporter n=1 Tax=Hoyosella altamirensis TaxID=616997 RepID=A0A839RL51_9ACTN|nr:biotin transporter BioY [Hoyosella altamirensis]MBB3036884.1 biotin transport system substrate-specific component [Hoyosella altamirensis]
MEKQLTRSRDTTADLALVALFAALIAVCAILPALKLTASGVPITLQTFGVLLAGAVLGARRGFLAVCLYLLVGFAGLPIFSGGAGGLGVLAGPTAGYLLAFPFAAALCGFLVEQLLRTHLRWQTPLVFLAGITSSFAFIHTFGIIGLSIQLDVSLAQALALDVAFWPGDVIKNIAMAIVATAVHRAFPDLLPRRFATNHAVSPESSRQPDGTH